LAPTEKMNSSIFNFKLFLKKFLLPFTVVVALFCFAFNYFFENKIIFKSPTTGAYKIHRILYENDPNEIPVFGSSRASGNYIPELIQPNVFNYGIERTQVNLTNFFLKYELSKNRKTPVIINFDYEFFEDSIGDITNYIANCENSDIKKLMKEEYQSYHRIPTIKYFGQFEHFIKAYLADHSSKNYHSKGGFFLSAPFSEEQLMEALKKRSKLMLVWKPDEEKSKNFIEMMTTHADRKFILVIAPYYKTYFNTVKNLPDAYTWLDQVRKIPNVYIIDYAKDKYADSLFQNTSHLNYNGAIKFSTQLKIELKKIDSAFN